MEKRRRKMVGRLDTSNPKPKWHKTIYLDGDVIRETIHDGNFSPSPQEPTLVFIPAQFCDELLIMNQKEENPQQISNGSYKYLRAAFIGENGLGDTNVFTIDGDDYEAETKGVIMIKNSTLSDFSASFQAFLAPYKDSCSIVVADAQIEDFLESGVHTLKIKNNGEESETMTFTVVPDYLYFEAAEANSTVSMVSSLATAPDLEYSTDGVAWQEWQHTYYSEHTFNTITLSAIGDRVYLRGNNPNGLGFYDDDDEITSYSNFSLTGSIVAGGNIMSLLDKTMIMTEVPDYGFMYLFYHRNGTVPLLTPPGMSTITSIGNNGCAQMYSRCAYLTTAANMPSLTNIGNSGCLNMFAGCTSITTAANMPSLTNIGDEGLTAMYSGCTFAMSNDGTTLNFDFPTPPITTTGDEPQTYATAYDVAEWMGNTNGFNE